MKNTTTHWSWGGFLAASGIWLLIEALTTIIPLITSLISGTETVFLGTQWIMIHAAILGISGGLIYPRLRGAMQQGDSKTALLKAGVPMLGLMLLHVVLQVAPAMTAETPPEGQSMEYVLLGCFFMLLFRYAIVFFAMAFHAGFVVRQQQKEELLQAQLHALRSQIQPHFLFNTLQSIAVMCQKDGPTAARMTVLLGDMLRSSLENRTEPQVTVAEERTMLEPYIELQKLRFADRLQISFEIDRGAGGAMIPDMILQPLVENALKHGIERKTDAGTVSIRVFREKDQLVCEVADNGVGLSGSYRPGTGLSNVRDRLKTLYGEQAGFELLDNPTGGAVARITLPFREAGVAA